MMFSWPVRVLATLCLRGWPLVWGLILDYLAGQRSCGSAPDGLRHVFVETDGSWWSGCKVEHHKDSNGDYQKIITDLNGTCIPNDGMIALKAGRNTATAVTLRATRAWWFFHSSNAEVEKVYRERACTYDPLMDNCRQAAFEEWANGSPESALQSVQTRSAGLGGPLRHPCQ
mmetsp:Transcript_34118/g.62429  ORF Transcript_34118/g.62429 Transcript_34118/m.62429 type:complete len:172 (-) Transcript_34118:62-577(-)